MPGGDYAIRTNERVTIVGKTGSGKTYLARLLTLGIGRLVVFDPKGTMGDPAVLKAWNLENWSADGARKLRAGKPVRLRVAPAQIGDDIYAHWIPYMLAIYEAGDCTLYIDEIYGVTRPNPSPELAALYTRGRELGIGVFAATQRPTMFPLILLSEAEWTFTFRLRLPMDIERMAMLMQMDPATLSFPAKYGYWLFNAEWDAPIYSRGVGT